LVEFDTIDHPVGATVPTLDTCSGGMKVGRGGAGYEWERDNGQEKESEVIELLHWGETGNCG
jgi:hypothetical protein